MPARIDVATLNLATEFLMDYYAGESYTELRKREVRRLMKRWAGFLGEVKDKQGHTVLPPLDFKVWPMMATVLENQVLANPRPRDMFEATTKSGVSLPIKYTLPIIRNVFPTLIMNRICSVQPMPPMSGGTMQLFWMNVYREDAANSNVTVSDSDYAISEENAVPKRLKMEVTSATTEAEKWILNATWSTEVEEDAMGALGLSVEREMIMAMSEEIMRELEEIVLNEILVGATAGNATWTWTVPATFNGSYTEYYQTLFHALIDAENLVRVARYQWCNYIVCGTTVAAYLQKAAMFDPGSRGPDPAGPITSGVVRMGTAFQGRWEIYSTPYINANRAIVSYYPRSMLHAGYIWAPYIPITPMPRVYGEMKAYDDATMPGAYVNTDKSTRNVRTRNAKRLTQANMFATLSISA